MANPGPAAITTANTQLATASQNFTSNPATQVAQNGLRLLGSARGVSVGAVGDATTIPIAYAAVYSVLYVVVTNSQLAGVSGSIATAAAGLFTAAAAGGTAIVANAAFTGLTGATVVSQRTVASTAAFTTATTPVLYLNVGTAVATGTCDVFVYGFDLS